ncbi:hypothetical protein KOW79_016551 [Hemibagrus wyckioides]|uniref:Uncharacterized protein n=1 Tax=Hemibagrus wyckioides TaxID=337641 RepID=A0A9D3NDP9_9TELE|nr:hypothetical protein KOW79_016551 [Hemibagrus wyckioides]
MASRSDYALTSGIFTHVCFLGEAALRFTRCDVEQEQHDESQTASCPQKCSLTSHTGQDNADVDTPFKLN